MPWEHGRELDGGLAHRGRPHDGLYNIALRHPVTDAGLREYFLGRTRNPPV